MSSLLTIFHDRIALFPTDSAAGAAFNDVSVTLPDGVFQMGCNVLDGWDDTFPIDAPVVTRGQIDGDIWATLFPARARHVVMGGWVTANSRENAVRARTWLNVNAWPRSRDLYLVRYEPDATKYLTVRREGSATFPKENSAGFAFRFETPLVAVDPTKYALNIDISGTCGVAGVSSAGFQFPMVYPWQVPAGAGATSQLNLVNNGDEPTGPVCAIRGPLSAGWRLSNLTTGKDILVNVDVPALTDLIVDCRQQTVVMAGQTLDAQITGDFWTLQPGANTVKLFGEFDEDASLTVTAQSAWG